MNRRQFLLSSGLVGGSLLLCPLAAVANPRATNLFDKALFVNASDITTVGPLSGLLSGPNFGAEYIQKLKQGGINVVSTSMVFWLYDEIEEVDIRLHHFYRLFESHRDDLLLVRSYQDIIEAHSQDKIAIIMHAHTPGIIGGDLRRLELLHKLGLRIVGFSHQQSSLMAEGAGEDLANGDGGLTAYGIAALREMNRLNIIADFGHASDNSILQATSLSSQPVIVSHTCCRALARHKEQALLNRNISDRAIRAVAENGGVVGIMALTPHLRAAGSSKKPDVKIYADHIDHVINVAGIDYVGIGTETSFGGSPDEMKHVMPDIIGRLGDNTPVIDTFNAVANLEPGTGLIVKGMEDMADIKKNLIGEFIRRGYSDMDIEKILGLNFLRVYKTVLSA